jgi:hypothetical protein
VKVANILFKKYELIRKFVYGLLRVYDKSANPKRQQHTNQYSYKIRDQNLPAEDSSDDESESKQNNEDSHTPISTERRPHGVLNQKSNINPMNDISQDESRPYNKSKSGGTFKEESIRRGFDMKNRVSELM